MLLVFFGFSILITNINYITSMATTTPIYHMASNVSLVGNNETSLERTALLQMATLSTSIRRWKPRCRNWSAAAKKGCPWPGKSAATWSLSAFCIWPMPCVPIPVRWKISPAKSIRKFMVTLWKYSIFAKRPCLSRRQFPTPISTCLRPGKPVIKIPWILVLENCLQRL